MVFNAFDDFLLFTADLFGVAPDSLSAETAFGSIPEWDSVMHLRLVMETEARYGTSIPLEMVPHLKTLADFTPYVVCP